MKTVRANWQASIGQLDDGTWGVQLLLTGFSSEEDARDAREQMKNAMEEAFEDMDSKTIKLS